MFMQVCWREYWRGIYVITTMGGNNEGNGVYDRNEGVYGVNGA